MNNKIKELTEQTIQEIDIVYENNVLNEELAKMYIPNCFAKQFAELIVKECASHIMNSSDRHRREYFAKSVLEHFGVE
jgi:hypothetical protein